MPPELALLGQLLGPIIGAAIAYFVMRGNQHHQAELEDAKDARALRDAERVRLVSVYESALTARVAMDHFASVQNLGQMGDEQQRLEAVLANIDQATARLMLEPGAQPVAQQFEQLVRQFTGLRIMQGQKMDPDLRLTDVQRRQDEFRDRSTALQTAIHDSLKPLDQLVRRTQPRLPPA